MPTHRFDPLGTWQMFRDPSGMAGLDCETGPCGVCVVPYVLPFSSGCNSDFDIPSQVVVSVSDILSTIGDEVLIQPGQTPVFVVPLGFVLDTIFPNHHQMLADTFSTCTLREVIPCILHFYEEGVGFIGSESTVEIQFRRLPELFPDPNPPPGIKVRVVFHISCYYLDLNCDSVRGGTANFDATAEMEFSLPEWASVLSSGGIDLPVVSAVSNFRAAGPISVPMTVENNVVSLRWI